MTRQLLSRSSARSSSREVAPAPARQTPPGPAVAVTPAPVRVLRRPAVLALVAVAAAVVAGLAWTLLVPASDDSTSSGSTLVRPRATPSATRSNSTGTAGTRSGRDPFATVKAAPVAPPTTSPHVAVTPSPSPAGTPGGAATGPTATATPRPVPSPGAPSAAPTVTVTVTAPTGPTYVGLYGWNGSRASFRVNARTWSVHVGTRFGPDLTFTAVVRGDPPCARVTHAKGSFTLCPGQVTTLP